MLFLDYLSHGKRLLTTQDGWICWYNAHGFVKTYDCIPHDLLIAKLDVYALDKSGLHFLIDYLSYRKQRTKTGFSFSEWWDQICGIPQRSIQGPFFVSHFPKRYAFLSQNLTYVILLIIIH